MSDIMADAIIVAAGKGLRMKRPERKQYLTLLDRPIISLTMSVFLACPRIEKIYWVVPSADIVRCRQMDLGLAAKDKPIDIICGGRERQESVFCGLQAMAPTAAPDRIVVVHDGVRPFVSAKLIDRCVTAANATGAAIAAAKVSDTLKRADSEHTICETISRQALWHALTPQAFRFGWLMDAHRKARREHFQATDDAQLLEWSGKSVRIVPGSRWNLKITTEDDLAVASALYPHFLAD